MSPLERVRHAHAHLKLGQHREALECLEGVDAPPARGVLLLVLCGLKDYSAVIERGYESRGHEPLKQEEFVYARYGQAIALGEYNEHYQSLMFLVQATGVAQTLGLSRRLRMLEVECARRAQLAGFKLPLLEAQAPTGNDGYDGWRNATRAELLFGTGDFRAALEVSKLSENADLVAFIGAALSEEVAPAGSSPLGRMASVVAELRQGRPASTVLEPSHYH